jgi:hypothetical protein
LTQKRLIVSAPENNLPVGRSQHIRPLIWIGDSSEILSLEGNRKVHWNFQCFRSMIGLYGGTNLQKVYLLTCYYE